MSVSSMACREFLKRASISFLTLWIEFAFIRYIPLNACY
jgi:hypothetical protein